MRENNLWFHDGSPVPSCVNWYQNKYSEHSYGLTVLATRKIHRHEHVHKSSNKDKSHSTNYSKHVHKSQGRDESKSSYHSIHVHTIRSRDEGKSSYYSKHVYNSCSKDEGKSSSHSRYVHKSRSKNEDKSASHSPHNHKHSSRDEITFSDYSRMLHLIEEMQKNVGLLRESIITYFATQHSPAITNSKSEISEEASCIPETDKLLNFDCLSEGIHKEDSEDVSPQDLAPITFPSDIITPVTVVLSPGDPALITFPSDAITPVTDVLSPGDPSPNPIPIDTIIQVIDGDPASITSPSDHSSLEEEKQEEASHMLSHHYIRDPYLHDIIWCDGLPYQQILAPSPTRSMLWLLLICLPAPNPTMQLQMLLCPKPHMKINTIDSLL